MDREFDVNYEEMEDYEISLCVANIVHDGIVQHGVNDDGSIYLDLAHLEFLVDFDPCNCPMDAWDIILENKISLDWAFDDVWVAKCTNQGEPGGFRKFVSQSENPLRAAMICFLEKMEK